MYRTKSSGPNTEPCGTPYLTFLTGDRIPLSTRFSKCCTLYTKRLRQASGQWSESSGRQYRIIECSRQIEECHRGEVTVIKSYKQINIWTTPWHIIKTNYPPFQPNYLSPLFLYYCLSSMCSSSSPLLSSSLPLCHKCFVLCNPALIYFMHYC